MEIHDNTTFVLLSLLFNLYWTSCQNLQFIGNTTKNDSKIEIDGAGSRRDDFRDIIEGNEKDLNGCWHTDEINDGYMQYTRWVCSVPTFCSKYCFFKHKTKSYKCTKEKNKCACKCPQ